MNFFIGNTLPVQESAGRKHDLTLSGESPRNFIFFCDGKHQSGGLERDHLDPAGVQGPQLEAEITF
jgi:hypothetical protein